MTGKRQCVLAEEAQCTSEGGINSCWGKQTRLHRGNAICVDPGKMDR